MADPRKPTRQELARVFNNDQRMIRAFEQLFEIIPSEINTTTDTADQADKRSKTNGVLVWLSML